MCYHHRNDMAMILENHSNKICPIIQCKQTMPTATHAAQTVQAKKNSENGNLKETLEVMMIVYK